MPVVFIVMLPVWIINVGGHFCVRFYCCTIDYNISSALIFYDNLICGVQSNISGQHSNGIPSLGLLRHFING